MKFHANVHILSICINEHVLWLKHQSIKVNFVIKNTDLPSICTYTVRSMFFLSRFVCCCSFFRRGWRISTKPFCRSLNVSDKPNDSKLRLPIINNIINLINQQFYINEHSRTIHVYSEITWGFYLKNKQTFTSVSCVLNIKPFFQYVYIFRINKVLFSAEFYAEINFFTHLDSKHIRLCNL